MYGSVGSFILFQEYNNHYNNIPSDTVKQLKKYIKNVW